jgi:hypothetical protein
MAIDEDDEEGIVQERSPLLGLYIGVVVDREDPDTLGRVRVTIPGLVEPSSAWAFPLGTLGGGSAQRGGYFVPEKDAEVGVLFQQGDVEHPYYLAGHWGVPEAGTEIPTPIKDATAADAPKIRTIETKQWVLTFDDRDGKEVLVVRDKTSGDGIEIDGAAKSGQGITIKATAGLVLDCDGLITIDGRAGVQINGRSVADSSKSI